MLCLLSIAFVFLITQNPLLLAQIPLLPANAEIKVGPNIRVGGEKTRQAEPFIAAHPQDSQSLIISVSEVVEGAKGKGLLAQSYVSNDAGETWSISELPDQKAALLNGRIQTELDNWVVFAPNGEAYYTELPLTSDESAPIHVFRSPNNGHTWYGPVKIAATNYDQPRSTASLYHGKVRIYISASSAGGTLLMSSDDGGLSFSTVAKIEPDDLSHQAMNPLVLADGAVLLPYVDFPESKKQQLNFSRIYVARSEDGGKAFGLPRFVADIARPYPGGAAFATDLSTGRFHGNVYATWERGDFGPRMVSRGGEFVREESGKRSEVAVARSINGGRDWSVPRTLQAAEKGPAHFSTLAVSSQGTLGVLWIQDEQYESNAHCYRVWFAASVDGGDSFSPPASVSNKISCSEAKLNPEAYFKSRVRGGDYIGLAAAANGSFHAVWIDARDGAFRLYTARVEVSR